MGTVSIGRLAAGVGGSGIDTRTTRHAGYRISQRKRKRVEQSFGWMNNQ